MATLKKGQTASCSACGRKVLVNECGTSLTTIWCCGQPMEAEAPGKAGKKPAGAGGGRNKSAKGS